MEQNQAAQSEETPKIPPSTEDTNIDGKANEVGSDTSESLKASDNKQVSQNESQTFQLVAKEYEINELVEETIQNDKQDTTFNEMGIQITNEKSVVGDDDDDRELWNPDLKFPETEEEVQHAKNLFSTIMDSERIKMMQFPSMLISGFGLRNYPSLCKALQHQQELDENYKQRKLKEEEEKMARQKKFREIERQQRGEFCGESGTSFSNWGSQTDVSTISTSSHPDPTAQQRRRIEYLMGLCKDGIGGEDADGRLSTASVSSHLKDDDTKSCGPEKEEPLTGTTDSIRQAQQYLRAHHIFEFFQFLIVHLLSKVPENPIEFLLVQLDKLLIYRSGLATAPLHYKKKHLEQLFYLMDKMRTGYIDLQQYKTGMNTIGIKCFNKQPLLNEEGHVSKEFFVEEAYQCSCCILNKIIRVQKVQQGSRKKYFPFPNDASQIT